MAAGISGVARATWSTPRGTEPWPEAQGQTVCRERGAQVPVGGWGLSPAALEKDTYPRGAWRAVLEALQRDKGG